MTTGIGSLHAGVLYTLSGLAAVVVGGEPDGRDAAASWGRSLPPLCYPSFPPT
jgi:hypothetical protein